MVSTCECGRPFNNFQGFLKGLVKICCESLLLTMLARRTLENVFCLTSVVHWHSMHWDTAEPIR